MPSVAGEGRDTLSTWTKNLLVSEHMVLFLNIIFIKDAINIWIVAEKNIQYFKFN